MLPLPTTPLFVAAGMAKLKPYVVIPPFVIGKLASDTIAVLMGKYAVDNGMRLMDGMLSAKSIGGFAVGLLLLFLLLFVDWRTLHDSGKLTLKFAIWR